MPHILPSPTERAPFRHAPTAHDKRAMRSRGPKDRPQIRLEQHATWRVRMRIWCNTIKCALLGSAHYPREPQTYRVIQHPDCPISNASTWLTWWRGDAVPQPTQIASAERFVPGSAQLLDLHALDTALRRNLFAIDLVRLEVQSIATAQRERGDPAWRLLRTIGRSWCGTLSQAMTHLRDGGPPFAPGADISPSSSIRRLSRWAHFAASCA